MGSQVEKPQSLPEEVVASFGKVGETNPQSQNKIYIGLGLAKIEDRG